ncbi:hypothetical protein PFISCL1PPCAC_25366, partial [Pristionchus fissidentatus]
RSEQFISDIARLFGHGAQLDANVKLGLLDFRFGRPLRCCVAGNDDGGEDCETGDHFRNSKFVAFFSTFLARSRELYPL